MTDNQTQTSSENKKPDWTVKTPKGSGSNQRLQPVGAGWSRDDGGICIRLSGTQVVEHDLYIYQIDNSDQS